MQWQWYETFYRHVQGFTERLVKTYLYRLFGKSIVWFMHLGTLFDT